MQKAIKFVIKEGVSELEKLKSKQPSLSKQKRVLCLLHLNESKFDTRQKLADYLGVSIRTQERWLVKYREGGINELLSDKPKNRSSKIITQEIHDGLKAKVNNSENPLLGYWEAQQWVFQQYDVEIKYHWLRKYLIKHFKTKLKVPRKSHYKKDEQAIEAFLKTAQ